MGGMTEKPRRKRLPYRFGLRALLTLMLLACAFCGGWVANEWKHRRELERLEREALLNTLTSGLVAP